MKTVTSGHSFDKRNSISLEFSSRTFQRHESVFFDSLRAKVVIYRNQSIDLQTKSVEWFLYDENFDV